MKISEKISIILPAYNEAKNLELLIPALDSILNNITVDYEIIVVNDCSNDNTKNALLNMSEWFLNLRLISLNKRMGQSFAVWEGVQKSVGDIIIIKDADYQTDPNDIPMMVESLMDSHMVCGVRRNRNDSALRKISSIVANRIRRVILNSPIIDSACGFKVFKRECVDRLEFFDGMHRFMPDLFLINGFMVKQVEIKHYKRRYGNAKYNIRNRGVRVASDLIMVWNMKNLK